MNKVKQTLSSLMNDESGQDLIEYALVASIIALGAVTVMGTVAAGINTAFTSISTKLNAAV